jgi:hypothetical protein
MEITFQDVVREMGPDAMWTLMNGARPPQNYVLSRFLPERPSTSYYVESGTMLIRPTMAGLSGMDSPYAPVGAVDMSTFLQQTAKITSEVAFPEKALRTLQELLMRVRLAGGGGLRETVQEVLNFANAMIVQPHLDVMEWLRGQALSAGALDWTFNAKELTVDYSVPSANKLTARTGTAGYGGSASVFWSDIRAAMQLLAYDVAAIVTHIDTMNVIVANSANNVLVTQQDFISPGVQRWRIQRRETIGGNTVPSSDARDSIEVIAYGLEGEVINPADPDSTVKVPFYPRGKVSLIGNARPTGYVVGAGSQLPEQGALGYTHLGPTVEGNGRAGRWARVYTPEGRPWSLVGQGVQNALPVIEWPQQLVILTTEMPA